MVTKETIKKLIDEKWDKLTIQEKTYVNSSYTSLNLRLLNKSIKSIGLIILSLISLTASLKYHYLFVELMGYSRFIFDYRSSSIFFLFFGILLMGLSIRVIYKDSDWEKELVEELEDYILETTKKRK